jgi:hypothetical protein
MRDEGGKKKIQKSESRGQANANVQADAEDGCGKKSARSATQHELLADFYLNLRPQTAD